MDAARLWADLVVNAVVALVYAVAGARTFARSGRHDADAETLPFSLWWFGLTATAVLGSVTDVLALLGVGGIAWMGGLAMLTLVAFTLALGGLVLHMLRPWVRGPLVTAGVVVAYLVYDAAQFYVMLSQVPAGVRVDGWRPVLDSTATLDLGFMIGTAMGLLLPPLAAGASETFAGVRARSRERALTGIAIVAWCAGLVLIVVPQLAHSDVAQAVARLLVLASGAAIYAAHAGVATQRPRTTDASPAP